MTGLRRARGYSPLAATAESRAVLAAVLAQVRAQVAQGGTPVVGFDLDGCVFDTRPRQVHIFRELASRRGYDELYRVETEHFRDWSLANTMRNAGVPEAFIAATEPEVRQWWASHFFTTDYVLYDHAMPGAVSFCRDCAEAGAIVVYLTGRDINMRAGTEEALRRFGFPCDDASAMLITKPSFEMDDTAFKESALEAIAARGEVVSYFDNEPANVNLFHERHPGARVVFVETDHSPRPVEPDEAIPWIRSFLRT
ncbi:MAG: hypothetical protein FJ090_16355 [Deltaproteobacteria bacterium]|nr:hypothetical protein [Deltaproteobacteria bacterium]